MAQRKEDRTKFIYAIIILAVIVLGIVVLKMRQKTSIGDAGTVELKVIASGFVSPADVVQPDDGTGRLFIVDRIGEIKIVQNNALLNESFLDIKDRVIKLSPAYDERGLLSVAFHPNFKNNGRFFVFYNRPLRTTAPKEFSSTITISEFRVSQNPNEADLNSEKVLYQIDNPYMNHNGGQLIFGPDGYLYFSKGDGGNANDVGIGHNTTIGNGQDTFSPNGKILRIDVDHKAIGKNYAIPSDNPFADSKNGLPEIFAYGFRNPWRMEFSGNTLFVGDVGQNLWEEIDIVTKGNNYGWNIKEGTHCFDPKNADVSPTTCRSTGYKGEKLIDPVIEYKNAVHGGIGHANICGYIYEGNALPFLKGKFVFGDWSTSFVSGDGSLFVAEPAQAGLWPIKNLKTTNKNGRLNAFLLSFGKGTDNELYISTTQKAGPSGNTGVVYKLVAK